MTETSYPARSRYQGDIAREYLEHRKGGEKWAREQALMSGLIAKLPPRSTVLDVPIGTARYLEFYERAGARVFGLDVSLDMLREARRIAGAGGAMQALLQGDASNLPLRDGGVDFVVSTRLLNWFPEPVFRAAIRDFARVARRGALVGVRLDEALGLRHAADLRREVAGSPRAIVQSLIARVMRRQRRLRRAVFGGTSKEAPPLILHPTELVLETFASAGFVVDAKHVVTDGTAFTRRLGRHTPLCVFELHKR
jgi:ubiquinone/menaquinone biosynthesis C-methylase UbiE